MYKRIVVIVALVSCLYSYAAEQASAPIFSTYVGEQLTPESLPLFAPQLPKEDLKGIREWLKVPLHNKTIRNLMHFPWPLVGFNGNFQQQQFYINDLLKRQGMPNLATWNNVIDMQGTKYIMTIAGYINRVNNLIAVYRVLNSGRPLDLRWLDTCNEDTYQGVSRLASYLRASEAIEKFNLDQIKVPKTYLIGLDTDMPDKVNDENSIVIQEKYGKDVKPIRDVMQNVAGRISEDAVKQVLLMIVYAGIFDVSYTNLLVDTSKSPWQFVISDLEQPNGSSPRDFFHKNEASVLGNIRSGIKGINTVLGNVPYLKNICQKFLNMTDQELKQIGSGRLPESLK